MSKKLENIAGFVKKMHDVQMLKPFHYHYNYAVTYYKTFLFDNLQNIRTTNIVSYSSDTITI